MGKRFLFVMVEGGGNVPPQAAIVRRLVARGHRVHVLSDPAVEADARAAGATFSPFVHAPHQNMRDRHADLVRDWEPKTPMGQFARTADRVFFDPAEHYARDVLEAAARVKPDALAIDILSIGAMAGAERTGIPSAAIFHMPYSVPTEGIPPLGMGFLPATGPLGRLRDRIFRWLIFRTFDAGLPRLNAARAAIDLPPLGRVFDQFGRLCCTLVLTSRAYDFVPPSLGDDIRYVGAQLDDPAWVEPWESPWPPDAREPLVLVSLGTTYQKQDKTLGRLTQALAALPVRAIVTLGGQFDPADMPRHPNVAWARSAPHASILPLASLVVCHGGHGTVMKALAQGVPVVCVPFGRDQRDNGARLRHAGAGVVVSAHASARRFAATIRAALDDASLRQGARRLQTAIAEDTARDAAVAELERLAGTEVSRELETLRPSGPGRGDRGASQRAPG